MAGTSSQLDLRYPFDTNQGVSVTCDYDSHLLNQFQRQYPGTDYGNGTNFPLYAIEDGLVLKGYDPYGAKVSVLYSPYNVREWVYVHLDSQTKFGQVKKGQLLGYAGKTGLTNGGIHLHLMLKIAGQYLDPDQYINDNISILTLEQMDEINRQLADIRKLEGDIYNNQVSMKKDLKEIKGSVGSDSRKIIGDIYNKLIEIFKYIKGKLP